MHFSNSIIKFLFRDNRVSESCSNDWVSSGHELSVEKFKPLVDLSGFDWTVSVHFACLSSNVPHQGKWFEKVSFGGLHAWDFTEGISFQVSLSFPFGICNPDILDVNPANLSEDLNSSPGGEEIVPMIQFDTHLLKTFKINLYLI